MREEVVKPGADDIAMLQANGHPPPMNPLPAGGRPER